MGLVGEHVADKVQMWESHGTVGSSVTVIDHDLVGNALGHGLRRPEMPPGSSRGGKKGKL